MDTNKFKSTYIKYLNLFSKYLEICFNDQSILVETSIDNFPHLVGKPYLPKYKKLSIKKFIDDISNDKLNNKNIYKIQDKEHKNIVLNKLKAINKIITFKNSKIIYKNIRFSKNLLCNAAIYMEFDNNKKIVVILLKKDNINIFHLISIILLNHNDKKYKLLIKIKNHLIIESKTLCQKT